ncbi:MAG: sulfotransferase [Bauldia sp.]|nr:MAG: sulfotransferase [Bauldia sp.]MBZ0229034.1 sulfotransferase [Bauldia sp.]
MTITQEQDAVGRDRGDRAKFDGFPWNPFRIERSGGPAPYVWHGMRFGAWLRLMAAGDFDVTFNCLPRILSVTAVTPLNSLCHFASQALYGRRIAETRVQPPVFILGHWRTGTTLTHELLSADPRFGYPTTFQCMFPSSFMLMERILGRSRLFVPKTRPTDNMSFGFDSPQEEEFALANLGLGTIYRSLAFPTLAERNLRYLDLSGLSADERKGWEDGFAWFIKQLQFVHGKRLVLKSPLHTARVATLLKLYPEARFVHLARNPYEVFPSTLSTWKAMCSGQGLRNPLPADDGWLRDGVFDYFDRLYAAYERDRDLVPAGNLVEIRYEDLVSDTKAVLRGVYDRLDLGDFDEAEPGIDAYLTDRKGYRRNVHELGADERAMIRKRWRWYFERHGYAS